MGIIQIARVLGADARVFGALHPPGINPLADRAAGAVKGYPVGFVLVKRSFEWIFEITGVFGE
jgi:hypothetical protein